MAICSQPDPLVRHDDPSDNDDEFNASGEWTIAAANIAMVVVTAFALLVIFYAVG